MLYFFKTWTEFWSNVYSFRRSIISWYLKSCCKRWFLFYPFVWSEKLISPCVLYNWEKMSKTGQRFPSLHHFSFVLSSCEDSFSCPKKTICLIMWCIILSECVVVSPATNMIIRASHHGQPFCKEYP